MRERKNKPGNTSFGPPFFRFLLLHYIYRNCSDTVPGFDYKRYRYRFHEERTPEQAEKKSRRLSKKDVNDS